MDRERFGSAIAATRNRVRAAMANVRKSDGRPADRSRTLLDEIQNALEELLVAEGELRRQDGDLRAAIAAAEAEGTRYRELFELMPSGYLVLGTKGTSLD